MTERRSPSGPTEAAAGAGRAVRWLRLRWPRVRRRQRAGTGAGRAGPRRPWGLLAGLAVALGALAAGIWLPSLSVETFPLIEDSVSIWQGLGVLWADDQYFLFAVLGVFSVLFPTAKLLVALAVAWRLDAPDPRRARLIAVMDGLAKWSMLDVLVVAIIVAALNLTVIGGVAVHPGLYLFALSVILSKLLIGRLARICRPPQ